MLICFLLDVKDGGARVESGVKIHKICIFAGLAWLILKITDTEFQFEMLYKMIEEKLKFWTLTFELWSRLHDLFFSGSFVDNNSYGCTKLGKIMTSKCIIVSKTLWNFQVNSLNRTEFTDSKFQYFANWVQTIDTLFPTKLVNFVSRVKLDCLLNIGRLKW